jgi:hypothetical protein
VRCAAALFALTLALGGCAGAGTASPEEVVRSWSAALNAGDNDGAADLFASGAEVVQAGTSYRLSRHDEAVRWNAALPCDGKIVALARGRRERGDRGLRPLGQQDDAL